MQKLHLQFFSFSIILLFLVSSFLNAQDKTAAAKTPPEDDPCWGLNFMWNKDFTVGKQLIDRFDFIRNTPGDEESSTGFGLEYMLGPKSSIGLTGSVGIGSDELKDTISTTEFSSTELGIKLSYNYYPLTMDKKVFFSLGPWISYVSYSDENTFTPSTGNGSSTEYSASRFGFGANATAYVKFWDDLNLFFFAGYNLGAYITPSSTLKTTFGGQTNETEGPSSFHFQDCGGMAGIRFAF